MVVQDVSVGFGGMVCLVGRIGAVLGVDFAAGTNSLCRSERWFFNLVAQTDVSSVDGYLVHERARSGARHFGAVAGAEGFA
ncbi:hypothetical protein F4W67_22075 [Pseudomonas caricapapayae]|nr:hypothetical protein [Pseudomonas caricapapayae]KAA8693089.1 hypothetical protein F4W67_22075 [Pseudomonas caricapapayae]